jgi:proteasome lid subunit RPN8/RPN11
MTPYKPIDVVIENPDAITAFKRRALKAKEHEILGVLVGRVRGKVYVEDIVYPKHVDLTQDCVHYYPDEFKCIPGAIGTIHSHPGTEPCLSKDDMTSQSTDGDVVFAIYSFWLKAGGKRLTTSLDWYCGSPEVLVSTSTGE